MTIQLVDQEITVPTDRRRTSPAESPLVGQLSGPPLSRRSAGCCSVTTPASLWDLLFLHTSFGSVDAVRQGTGDRGASASGAAVGAFGSGRLSDRIGRRPVTPHGFGLRRRSAGAAFSPTLGADRHRLCRSAGRGFGIHGGPLYISEVAPPGSRCAGEFQRAGPHYGDSCGLPCGLCVELECGVAAHVWAAATRLCCSSSAC